MEGRKIIAIHELLQEFPNHLCDDTSVSYEQKFWLDCS